MLPDKWQALQQFWEQFGLPAYAANSVPKNTAMPYITYEAAIDDFGSPVPLSANIYYRSLLWSDISRKASEISAAIGDCYLSPIEGGYICIRKGSPFAQRMKDEEDSIKRIYINIEVEYYAP
jgi:hypothetical protein